jgi:hypothetical protein
MILNHFDMLIKKKFKNLNKIIFMDFQFKIILKNNLSIIPISTFFPIIVKLSGQGPLIAKIVVFRFEIFIILTEPSG